MSVRFFVSVLVGAAVLSSSLPAATSAGSSRPNPKAGKLCGFGPGKARWPVKTSIPKDQDPSQRATVPLDVMINAPNLQPDATTVAAAVASVKSARAAMKPAAGANALLAAPAAAPAPFTATLHFTARAGKRSSLLPSIAASPAQSRTVVVKFPGITPALVKRADALVAAANPEEAAPSTFDALLSTQLDATRLPDAVALGDDEFHEGDVISVSGVVVSSVCEKDDGDFHIDLGDSDSADTCAIVEVPNPAYIKSASLKSMVTAAEKVAKSLRPGDQITVSGQLFYDATHATSNDPGGGRGSGQCAQSLWEVHPVFEIVKG